MALGPYFEINRKRIDCLTDNEWMVALKKCKEHIRLKIRQKTLYGAHSQSNLGGDPVAHYLGLAYEKILSGEWEWQNQFDLPEQMIRIVNSYTSKEVGKTKTTKAESLRIVYKDIETEIYDLGEIPDSDQEEIEKHEATVKRIEEAIKQDSELELFWEAVKDGMKRVAIAKLLDLTPKQLDKLKEKFIRRVRNYQPSAAG